MIWVSVLALAIANPGLTYQTLVGASAFAWFKYLNTVMLVTLLAGVLIGGSYLATRRNALLALRFASVVTLVVFLWSGFSALDALPTILGTLAVVLVPAMIIWLVVRHGDRLIVAVLSLAMASTLVAVNVAIVSGRTVSEPAVAAFPPIGGEHMASRPDVLFVLLDAYGRDDVLREMYGFDNAEFLQAMGDLGFSINRSASANYDRSYATVASMMDLNYPIESGLASAEQDGIVRGLLGQRGSLVSAFSDAGYEMTYSENAWQGSRCGQGTDRCWRSGTTMMSAYSLAQLSPLAPVVERFFVHPVNAGSFAQLSALANEFGTAVESERPQLVWSHFILPHPPVRLDRSCGAHRDPWRNSQFLTMGDQDDELRRDAYIDQIVCVNATL
jgi:hypothetical protein